MSAILNLACERRLRTALSAARLIFEMRSLRADEETAQALEYPPRSIRRKAGIVGGILKTVMLGEEKLIPAAGHRGGKYVGVFPKRENATHSSVSDPERSGSKMQTPIIQLKFVTSTSDLCAPTSRVG